MSTAILIGLFLLSVAVVWLLGEFGGGGMRVIIAIPMLLLAAFCVYGFLASAEPGPNHIYFRIGYPVVGLICVVISLASLITRRGK